MLIRAGSCDDGGDGENDDDDDVGVGDGRSMQASVSPKLDFPKYERSG